MEGREAGAPLRGGGMGDGFIPGTTQLTRKDILYRLQSSKAKCIITNEVLAPAVDAVASKCENLHSKLIVSQNPREGWGNLKEMIKQENLRGQLAPP
ncbi:acyl-coenzyme A synthetase ACSM3, mitochondrial-like [Equus caballus]|uniref:acyl-coenzyme A synthetase ACSM3, mitochondrial-like n=1 Tax=Equus caballus TaxID=9796 RepID=UPI0038B35EF9